MPPLRVILLRAAAWAALGAGALAPPAVAATGGAGVPGGLQPSSAAPAESAPAGDIPSATPNDPSAVAASTTSSSADVATTQLVPQPAALPILATAARRPTDPVTQDLAALSSPTPLAAIDGHVVVVRARGTMSELVDLGIPTSPRVLLASTRVFGTPHAGRDANGRPVIVVSPCAGSSATADDGQTPRCPLRTVDLQSAVSAALPGTTGALAGDLAGTHLVFSRTSPQTGVRLYEATVGGAARPIALPPLLGTGIASTPATKPVAGSVRATSFDVDDTGRLAVVLEYIARSPTYSSTLWLRSAAGAWTRLVAANTGFAGLGTRHVLGPRLDATGVSAYVEGVVETPSYLGHWTADGTSSSQTSLRRSIGRATIVNATAYDSGRLLFEDWSPGDPCGSEGALACGLRSVGPVTPQ
ncbi:MAG: hypothetical protein AAGC46_16420 [Solirubrobacteraceae bacterium]|nr:hypothetical protein [Patulibacter sp.]